MGDVYRAEIWQNTGSEPTMNVLHIRESVAETGATPVAQLIVEMVSAAYDLLAAELSEDWRVIAINARRVSPTGGVPASLVLGAAESIVGAVASEIVPAQAAILISLYTNTGDRTGRGRVYLPGCPELHQNEGQLLEAAWGDMQTAASAAFEGEKTPTGATDGRFRFMVFGGGASPDAPWDVQAAIVRPNLATQKRRRAFPGFGAV